ncbi:MAG: hypothetical protein AAGK97_04560, partial [Bacteroidota bacterium]
MLLKGRATGSPFDSTLTVYLLANSNLYLMEKIMTQDKSVDLKQVTIDNEIYFRISNNDSMRPFFMSIVSDSDHWMFISS